MICQLIAQLTTAQSPSPSRDAIARDARLARLCAMLSDVDTAYELIKAKDEGYLRI